MYYLVAYGHCIRCEQASFPDKAMMQAFGLVDNRYMTLVSTSKKPSAMSRSKLGALQSRLAVQHFHRTGSVIAGYEREPGIENVHWTTCQLCTVPIVTEPKAHGIDEVLCTECEAKLGTVPEAEQEQMSIAKLRNQLAIKLHCSNPVL